jgi:hypothetical protein
VFWYFSQRQLGQPSGSVSADEPARHASCDASEYRQFDFWVGDWNAFEEGSTAPVARLRVDRLLDGCVLREDYEGADAHKGVSFEYLRCVQKGVASDLSHEPRRVAGDGRRREILRVIDVTESGNVG